MSYIVIAAEDEYEQNVLDNYHIKTEGVFCWLIVLIQIEKKIKRKGKGGGRMKKHLSAILALVLVLSMNWCMVQAETPAKISLTAQSEENGVLHVLCQAQSVSETTNGKIRILYDADVLKLENAAVGDAMQGFVCQINDSVQGTKEEGELVFVFASGTEQKLEGDLINLTFSAKNGDMPKSAEFSLKVEELQATGQLVDIQLPGEKVVLNLQPTEPQPPTDPTEKPTESEEPSETEKPSETEAGKSTETEKPAETETGKSTETEKTAETNIKVKIPKLKKVTSPAKGKIRIQWKTRKNISGYEIKIARNKKFTKSVKTVKVKKAKVKAKTLKIKSGQKYFVRIQAYKKIGGKKYYSNYSKVKWIRVK